MERLIGMSVVGMLVMLSSASLALDRTNTAQKGSLLIFPLVDVSPGKDTLVRIENHNTANVNVRCTWQNGTAHTLDMQMVMAASAPLVLIASSTFPTDVGPGDPTAPTDRGELKCWAISADGQAEINWNHLSGSANIIDFDTGTAKRYTAWAVRCLATTTKGKGKGKKSGGDNDTGACGETPGILLLDGEEYESCPRKLGIGFSPTGAFGGLFGASELHVATCNQDFRQDREPTYTKLQFETWDEDTATRFSGAFSCMDNWHETELEGVDNNPQIFSLAFLGNSGRLEVQGVESGECPTPTTDAGLVGVISTTVGASEIATNLVGIGEISGFVEYDPQGPVLLVAPATATLPAAP